MSRYARIKNNDKIATFKINGCDSCPMMKFDLKDSMARCKLYESPNGDDVVDVFVINSCEEGIVYDKIEIPNWCHLNKSLEELSLSSTVYRPFLNSVLLSIMSEDEIKNLNSFVIDIEHFKNKGDKCITDYMLQFVDRTTSKWDKMYDQMGESIRNYVIDNAPKKVNICSYCGEDDENIDRNVNFGMCDCCWEIHKSDKEIIFKSYINNFRLKRNKSILNKDVKIIDIVNI